MMASFPECMWMNLHLESPTPALVICYLLLADVRGCGAFWKGDVGVDGNVRSPGPLFILIFLFKGTGSLTSFMTSSFASSTDKDGGRSHLTTSSRAALSCR